MNTFRRTAVVALFVSAFLATGAFAQATYNWSNGAGGSWIVAANWTPTRTTPNPGDTLLFGNGGSYTVTAVPAGQTIAQLSVSGNTNVTLQPAATATTLTVAGAAGTDFSVAAGSQLNISGTNTLTIALNTGTTGAIAGSMAFTNAGHKLTSADASGITFQNGSVFTAGTGFASNAFGATSNTVIFASGSKYTYIAGATPFPASVFQSGSLFLQTGTLAPSFSGRTYANYELNNAAAVVPAAGAGTLIFESLTITAGTLNYGMTNANNAIKGNISVAAGATLNFNPASAGTVTLNGPAAQSITNAGTLTFNANQTVNVNNGNGVNLGSNITIALGTLNLTAGIVGTGANTLAIGGGTTVNRTAGYVNGNLKKTYNAVGSKTFEVGTANGYSPVTANVTAGGVPLDVTVAAIQGPQPNVNAPTSLSRYWTIGVTNAPTADLTFQYLAGDVQGNEANYQLIRVSGGVPTFFPGTVNAGTHSAALNGVTAFSDWTVGEPADTTPPVVTSVSVPANGAYRATQNLDFTVNFSENVTVTGGPRIPVILDVPGPVFATYQSGSGTTALVFRYTVAPGDNDGNGIGVGSNIDFNGGNIKDGANNPANPALNGVGSTANVKVDTTAPTVQSDIRASVNPTSANSVDFTVTFSEPVSGVDTADFTAIMTGIIGANVTAVSPPAGPAAVYTVSVSTGTGANGMLRLDVNNGASVQDPAGNLLSGGFTTGETYTIDRTAPTVSSIVRVNATPTNQPSLDYTVTFSSGVTGVDTGDFSLFTTGALVSPTIMNVTPVSASVYTVTVNTNSGDGTLRLDVNNGASIQAVSNGVPLSSGFTGGEVYTIDRTEPAYQSIVRANGNPTNAPTVHFTVTFLEPVTGVTTATFSLVFNGAATGGSVSNVTGSGATYDVTVATGTGDGSVTLNGNIDGAVFDLAGNQLTSSFPGQSYNTDRTPPTVLSINRSDANPSSSATVNFLVTFSEDVTGVDAGDFTLAATSITGASVTGASSVTPSTWSVSVNTGTGEGTLGLNLADNDTITDIATNPLGGTGVGNGNFTGQVYTIDKLNPSVVSLVRAGTSPSGATNVTWTLTFSEPVSEPGISSFAVVATGGVTGASLFTISGTGAVYTIGVFTGSGSGTVGLNFVDDDSVTDGVGKPVGGPGAGNGNFTGEVYTIDKVAPTVSSIVRASTNPSSATSVNWTVTFSKSVTGVNAADFAAAATGLSGASVTNVTGSGTTYTVSAATGTGNGTLGLNLVDDDTIVDTAGNKLGGTGTGNGNFTGEVYNVNRAAASHLVISQVYGGGGNSGSTFKNDFIELFNPSSGTVDITGWSVQYSSAAGSAWQVTPISGTVAPGHYYLVQEAQGAGGTVNLPASDATGAVSMAAGAGKVALVNQSSALSGACPLGITVIDFVGYGTTATCSEGATTANLAASTSASRIDNGCTDTDHNNTDFTVGAVNPRNSASAVWSCGSLVGNGTATPSTVGAASNTLLTVNVTPGQSPASTGLTVTGDLTPIGGSATQTFYDDGSHGDATAGNNVFSFDTTVPQATSGGSKTLNVAIADAQGRNGASTIHLTVIASTNPSASGAATPAGVAPNQSTLLTATVTGGQNPPSNGITVTGDLSSIGGSASQAFYDDGTHGDGTPNDGTFSFNTTVSAGTSLGAKSLPLTINDAQARTGSGSIPLTVQSASAPPAPLNLVAAPGNAQVSLTWNTSAGATGYNVYRSTTSNVYNMGAPLASNVATNNFLDTLVSNGTRYYYIVTATASGFESGPSNESNAMPAAPPPAGPLGKVYFIDIGQGASTLIVSPTGKSLLVDGGPTGQGTQKVVPLLTSLGITRLDYSVLTHYHIDHDDGLTETINAGKGPLSAAYDNGDTTPLAPPNTGSTKTAYQNYVNALTSHTITRIRPEDVGGSLTGTVIDLGGGMKATIMAQGGTLLSGGTVPIDNSDLNTESISVFVEFNNFDFLVSGDLTGGGSTSTAKTPDVETFVGQMTRDIDIVEYDHHGSTTANNWRFLRLLRAEAAVAETGFTNTFGHPNRETVNKYLNIPATSGNTYGGTALPNPGNGPVSYQTDPSPASDDRVSRQGYSGAAPADAGNGTILLKTDGLTAFTMESYEDGGARISPTSHAYAIDATGAGVTTNFPPTVIPSITPVVPLASDTVTVQAQVKDREDPITSVTLDYSLNGAAQAPVTMTLNAGNYEATIPPQPDGTRVDYTVTAVAGGASTAYNNGYFSGITPISTLRVLDPIGEPLYLDYAARISATATAGTGTYVSGTNDDYVQDATGGINIWRTIQPSVPATQSTNTGATYTIAGRIGELAGKFQLQVTPPFVSPTTPYTITQTGSATITPLVRTIAQLNVNPELFEGQLIQLNNCTVTTGTIPSSPAGADAFLTISDGTGSFQLKVDKDTTVPGMATPAGAFTAVGIIQQDDFLRPFTANYDIAPRRRTDIGGVDQPGQGLLTIAEARKDVDGSGFSPGDYVPDLLGQTVRVQGVVTSIDFRGGNGIEYYIQDPTGGIDIFNSSITNSLSIGDNVDVTGTMTHFFGLSEIDPGTSPSNIVLLPPNTLPAVTPRLITTADLGNNGVGEAQEGLLIRINNVTLVAPPATWAANTNYDITDGTNTAQIRIDGDTNLVGQAPPAGSFSIMGVVGQHSTNQSTPPFDLGYQLLPRFTGDVLPAVPAAASISATAGTPQSTPVNTAFTTQLQATVRDGSNNPINGAGVTFTAPGSGASGTFTGGGTSASVITDASGIATAPVFTANATTGTYNVTATTAALNTTFSMTNLPPAATHLSVSAPPSVTAGVAFNVTVSALNSSNAVVPGYTGTVHFSSGSGGTLPSDYTFTGGDSGTHTFSVTLTTAGGQAIDVTDGTISGNTNVTVQPPPATHFSVSAPASVRSGTAFNVTVTALDGSNATVTGYTGTIHFTSSSAGTLPADYTFVGGDGGSHTFSVTLTGHDSQSVSVSDGTSNGSTNVTLTTHHFLVTAPATSTSGTPFNVTVTALDAANATVTSYTGTVHFSSTSTGTLPADYTFTGGDSGSHTFSVTLTGHALHLIDVTDGPIMGTGSTTVGPSHFSVSAPANVTVGTPFNVTVTALDAVNATCTSYLGTIHFTSSSAGTLPADYTFVLADSGAHTFSVTLTSSGSQSISVADGGVTGTTNTTVANAPATHFSVSAPANVTAGSPFNVTVTALNASNGTVTGYTGTVHFTSSSAGTLPADYTFVGGDSGTHTFSVTLTSTGSQSITASDGTITGSTNTTVLAAPATHFSVTAPANVTAGTSFNVAVTALDASNATVTGYAGTVHFTSSSAGTLPADYAFVAGDNGTHTFSVTLTTSGSQSITAGDGTITGSTNTTVACPALSVTASNSGPVCAPNTVTLGATSPNSGVTYSWSGPGGFTSSSQNPTGITTSGLYTVTINNGIGCTATSSTTVVINPTPSAVITAPASVCSNTTGNVASVPAGATTYAWSITNGTITGGAGTNSITFTAAATGNVGIAVTVTSGACSASSSRSIPITTSPTANIPGHLAICGAGAVTIPVTLTGVAPWRLTWSDGNVQNNVLTSTTSRTVTLARTTTIWITSVTDGGCSTGGTASRHLTIDVDSAPSFKDEPESQFVRDGQRATFTAKVNGENVHYHWYQGRVGDASNEVGPDAPEFTTLPVHGLERYWLRIENTCGHVDSGQLFATGIPPRRRPSGH
jgi:beta-lactamase superfamily II metal-dependent hydrolase